MHTIEQIPQLPVHARKSWQQYLLDSLLAVVGRRIDRDGDHLCVPPVSNHPEHLDRVPAGGASAGQHARALRIDPGVPGGLSLLRFFPRSTLFYNQVYQMRLDPGVQYLLE